jgi:DeoR/GlpR family transcriptional regulator of sugar metabolism
MEPEKRRDQIIAELQALQSELTVEELARSFKVSGLTIRRDLERLEADKVILRTHGGCILRTSVQSAYHMRVVENLELKQAIGRAAATEVNDGDVILINDGSTSFHLAAHLGRVKKLSVFTNSLGIIPVLSRFPGIEVYVLGGQYDKEMRFVAGSMMERSLEELNFDKVFLGTDAIDAQGNCLTYNPNIARIAEIMLRRGARRILLADHTKAGAKGYAVYARLSDFQVWYTSPGISEVQLRRYRQQTSVNVATP